jgi:cell division protease FtsH
LNVNDLTKNILVFIVIIVVLLSVVQGLSGVSGGQPMLVDYSDFVEQVESGQVSIVEFDGDRIQPRDRQQHADRAAREEQRALQGG